MVVLSVKRPPREEHSREFDEFLVETKLTANVGEITKYVFDMQNLRVRLKWMASAAAELAKDLSEDNQHIMINCSDEAKRYLAYERTSVSKAYSTMEELSKLRETIKGATMMCFPAQCSGVDAQERLAALLDSETAGEKERGIAHRILSIIDEGAATDDIIQWPQQLWWSGKSLDHDADLGKYAGKNEKTKLVVKLGKMGGQAPPREPAFNAETQNEMMSYWYKKQEEAKKMVEDDDVSYANSEWANPGQLKSSLTGMGGIKFRPSMN